MTDPSSPAGAASRRGSGPQHQTNDLADHEGQAEGDEQERAVLAPVERAQHGQLEAEPEGGR